MRNFWRIVSPLRGWHPKTADGVDYFPSSDEAASLSIVRKFSAEKTRKGAEERLGLLPPVQRIIARTVRHLQASSDAMLWFTVHFLRFLFTKLTNLS